MIIRVIVLALLLLPLTGSAQTPVTTANGNASGTITTANVFQTVFPANGKRLGCVIQNQASGNMSVSEGVALAAPPVPASSFTLYGTANNSPYNEFSCTFGGSVLTGEIDITGPAGAPFFAAQW